MKAAFVLLADDAVQNTTRRLVYALSTRWNVPFFASLLPAHVSLKQPFTFESMEALEAYFDAFAASVPPLEIVLDGLYCEEWNGWGILGMTVVETPALRALHERLNAELPGVVNDASAAHDGPGYHFHLTIEMGKAAGSDPFRALYAETAAGVPRMTFTARRLGMFFYPRPGELDSTFITYRVMPLGG